MNWNDEQYERVARVLDGGDRLLSDDEKALRAEISRMETDRRRNGWEVPVPTAAMDRAQRRMAAALAQPRSTWWRRIAGVAVAASVAAVLTAVVLTDHTDHTPADTVGGRLAEKEIPIDAVVASLAEVEGEQDYAALSEEIDELSRRPDLLQQASRIETMAPSAVDQDLESIRDEIEQLDAELRESDSGLEI